MTGSNRLDARDIKAQTDIVNVISRTVDLKRAGSYYKGLCPFHDDSVPSMVVYPDSQRFKCFGCDQGGDIIEWVQLRHSLDFVSALAELSGLGDVVNGAPRITKEATIRVKPGYAVPRDIIDYWHRNIGLERRSYFYRRGFSDRTIDFELWGWTGDKYSIPVWSGSPSDGGKAFQVKFRRADDLEKARLEIDGFRGADLEEALAKIPKYMGMKGRGVWLYDGWKVRPAKIAVVFFGELDAALFNQDWWDDPFLAACSPTGGAVSWNEDWRPYFWNADEVVVVPDAGEEEQGRRFAAKIGGHSRLQVIPSDCGVKDYGEIREVMKPLEAAAVLWLKTLPN